MDNNTITLLFDTLFGILGIVVLRFLIPWIVNKIGAQNYAKLVDAIEIAIRWAEQNYPEYESCEKKRKVIEKIVAKAQEIGVYKSVDELSDMIDAFVNKIKYSEPYTKNKEG